MLIIQVVPGHVGMAVVDHIRCADQVRRNVPDGPGVRWRPLAVRGTETGPGTEPYRIRGGIQRVPVLPERRFVREPEVPGFGGRSSNQPDRLFRVPRRGNGVQRFTVCCSVTGIHQSKIPRVMTSRTVRDVRGQRIL